jgi:hypothetical protein
MLVVVAQPVGMALLSAAEEEQVVRRGFQELEDLGLATVEYMLGARIDRLHERLRNPDIDILHFIGHGTYQNDAEGKDAEGKDAEGKDAEGKEEGYLVFESPDGSMQLINSECLRQVLCQRGIRLIFLNACETGMVGRTQLKFDFNRGVAPKLVAGGIPVLVANQYKVLDVSATEFAKHFYRWLALGSTVGDAAREARVAVNYSIAGESIDWAVPVVYARNPGRMIYTEEEKAKVTANMKLSSLTARPAPCKGFKGTKVGLWDVNHVLPQLDDFAAHLNGLQTDFCFQSVEVSAPLGTWRRKVSDPDGAGGYINGVEVASKLKDHVVSLGVNRLICITVFALADDERQGLALWNEDKSQRVSIVSGDLIFAHIDNPRTSLNRFLANMLVSALCGLAEHKNGPPDCPNDYPDSYKASDPKDRAAALITKYKLCSVCSAKLGKQADSMDKILAAW